jgi:hypothetical protein
LAHWTEVDDMTDTGACGSISAEEVAATVELACRAPSLHNSQPWCWVFDSGILRLQADHGRVGRHTDSTGREVTLSCGATLDHLVIAAAASGWQSRVDRCPDPKDPDHLATIVFRRSGSIDEHDRLLVKAISQGRTDRLAFAEPEPWTALEKHPVKFCTAALPIST